MTERTIKCGVFPGRISEFVISNETTCEEVLRMADIVVGNEQELKLDGDVVSPEDLANGAMLLVTKRIKGAF